MKENKRAIRLEKNVKFSISNWIKHIRTKYFFETDRVEQGDLEIEHCPKVMMWANILTKPLQVRAFMDFR